MRDAVWDPERRARALMERRSALLDRLPGEIRAARDLRPDVRELILDEAITFAAVEHQGPVSSREDLERTLWDACAKRVRRAHEGRYEMVRAGWRRAEPEALEGVGAGANPEDEVLRRDEQHTVMEFAATLSPLEREVLACKYRGADRKPLGYKQIGRYLGLRRGDVLKAERAIDHKLERFATIVAAGRLCGFRAHAVASLAAGEATEEQATAARVHLQHCRTCAAAYKRHLSYLRGATFQRRVAALLPLPPAVAFPGGSTGLRDALVEWVSRPFGSQSVGTAAELASSGVGRGAGTVVAVKLASLCIGGAGTVGACVAAGVVPDPFIDRPPVERSSKQVRHAKERGDAKVRRTSSREKARAPVTPAPIATAAPSSTPTATPQARRRRVGPGPSVQGGTGPTDHERAPVIPRASAAAAGGGGGGGASGGTDRSPRLSKPAPPPATGSDEFF